MRQCHECGGKIDEDTGVQRVIKTGAFTGGAGYYRNVNLCARCAAGQDSAAKTARVRKVVFLLLIILAIAGVWGYFNYFR